MSLFDFNEITIFEDAIDNMDIIRKIINRNNQEKAMDNMDIIREIVSRSNEEDAFYVLDIGDVFQKHFDWITKMPTVIPHFAIKCNPDPTVIKILAALNVGFDCASEQEIRQVIKYGVNPDRIIFANPTKCPSHIKYAKETCVSQMTVDSRFELLKIKKFYPEAKIVIRIRCDAKNSQISLGSKFGCESDEEVIQLMQLMKRLDLSLHGFSFHVGSPCGETNAFSKGIGICKRLITVAKTMGFKNIVLIDIGGGIPGESGTEIDKFAKTINDALKDLDTLDSRIKVISEPGRYYVTSAFTLASYLHSKKTICKNGKIMKMYYTNCGVYNSFIEELLNLRCKLPQYLFKRTNNEKFLSTLWGPTCDSYDVILKDVLLPELYLGDWLIWKDMGAYSLSLSTSFNGFPLPTVIPIIKESKWEQFQMMRIEIMRKSAECINKL